MTTSLAPTRRGVAGRLVGAERPDVEIVVPVHNERLALEGSIRVDILATALADLRGVLRMLLRRPASGLTLVPPRRPMLAP